MSERESERTKRGGGLWKTSSLLCACVRLIFEVLEITWVVDPLHPPPLFASLGFSLRSAFRARPFDALGLMDAAPR